MSLYIGNFSTNSMYYQDNVCFFLLNEKTQPLFIKREHKKIF